MKLYTIGFTKKTAERFFTKLKEARVARIIDVRLNNVSQLAGFAKRDDLRYFAREIGAMDYVECPALAPCKAILDAYKKNAGDWVVYEQAFRALLAERRVERQLNPADFHNACLLCSEHLAEHCHRRLAAEYLQAQWGDIEIVHLA